MEQIVKVYISVPMIVPMEDVRRVSSLIAEMGGKPDYWIRNTTYTDNRLKEADAVVFILPNLVWSINSKSLTRGIHSELLEATRLQKSIFIVYDASQGGLGVYRAEGKKTLPNGLLLQGVAGTRNHLKDLIDTIKKEQKQKQATAEAKIDYNDDDDYDDGRNDKFNHPWQGSYISQEHYDLAKKKASGVKMTEWATRMLQCYEQRKNTLIKYPAYEKQSKTYFCYEHYRLLTESNPSKEDIEVLSSIEERLTKYGNNKIVDVNESVDFKITPSKSPFLDYQRIGRQDRGLDCDVDSADYYINMYRTTGFLFTNVQYTGDNDFPYLTPEERSKVLLLL